MLTGMQDLRSFRHTCPGSQLKSHRTPRTPLSRRARVRSSSSNGSNSSNTPRKAKDAKEARKQSSLDERILSGEFTTPPSWRLQVITTLQSLFGKVPGPGQSAETRLHTYALESCTEGAFIILVATLAMSCVCTALLASSPSVSATKFTNAP